MKNSRAVSYHKVTEKTRGLSQLATSLYEKFPFLTPPDYRVIKTLRPRRRILDVGTGTGWYLRRIHHMRPDLELYGLDTEEHPDFPYSDASFIKLKIESGSRFPFDDKTFAYVSCIDVLEHLDTQSMSNVITEIARVLADGDGFAYAKTPGYWDMQLGFFWDDPTHLRPHNKTSLTRLGQMSSLVPYKTWRGKGIKGFLASPFVFLAALYSRDRVLLQTAADLLLGTCSNIIWRKSG